MRHLPVFFLVVTYLNPSTLSTRTSSPSTNPTMTTGNPSKPAPRLCRHQHNLPLKRTKQADSIGANGSRKSQRLSLKQTKNPPDPAIPSPTTKNEKISKPHNCASSTRHSPMAASCTLKDPNPTDKDLMEIRDQENPPGMVKNPELTTAAKRQPPSSQTQKSKSPLMMPPSSVASPLRSPAP